MAGVTPIAPSLISMNAPYHSPYAAHTEPVRIGVIGCGKISEQYFNGCRQHPGLEMIACADLNPDKAKACAQAYGIPRHGTVETLLADADVELILNLTIPSAHAPVTESALLAGKHVYLEKPLALEFDQGHSLVQLAETKGLLLGCAPDTFLGSGQQTARFALDAGLIGRPVAGLAFILLSGHESWHPNPEFYYQPGGGPLFDMGPYYLTALIHLLGPVAQVSAVTGSAYETRTVGSGPNQGKSFPVEVPTHYSTTLEFSSGPIVTLVLSFDTWQGAELPSIQIHGTEGTLLVPDPNHFDQQVLLRRPRHQELETVQPHGPVGFGRGLGVADMAASIRNDGRIPARIDARMALHVLETMCAIDEAARRRQSVALTTRCPRPLPMYGAAEA